MSFARPDSASHNTLESANATEAKRISRVELLGLQLEDDDLVRIRTSECDEKNVSESK